MENATDAEYLANMAPDLARAPVQIAQMATMNH
jgi:hypothetical protein